MRRTRAVVSAVVLSAALLAPATGSSSAGEAPAAGPLLQGASQLGRMPAALESKPNILLIMVDDVNKAATPYLTKTRRWFADGTRFANGRVAISSCCPSRSTLYTGRYPHNNGVRGNGDGPRFDKDYSLARYAKLAGYRTGMAGKFLTTWPRTTQPPYFDRHTVIWDGYYGFSSKIDGVARYQNGYSTTFLGQEVRRHLGLFEQDDARPWLEIFTPQAMHVTGCCDDTAVPEKKYVSAPVGDCVQPGESDRSDKPPYVRNLAKSRAYLLALCQSQARTVLSIDDEVDLTMKWLADHGELQNTIVVFTSDNGYHWGEHGWHKKFLPYDPSVRVPLMIRGPGFASGTDTRLVGLVDLLPTFVEAMGVAPLKALDGKSLWTSSPRSEFYMEYFVDQKGAGTFIPSTATLVSRDWKFIRTYDDAFNVTFEEYYNLKTDPQENVNLLRDGDPSNDPSPVVLTGLRQRLETARSCLGSTCP